MLKCPNCKSLQLYTMDSRNTNENEPYLYRRRECKSCGHRFTTIEIEKEQYDDLLTKKMHLKALSIALSRYSKTVAKTVTDMAHKTLFQMQANAYASTPPPDKKPKER